MQKVLAAAALITAPLLAVPSAQADLPLRRTLPTEIARGLAVAALAACREQAFRVTVTVLDQASQTLVLLRDVEAAPHTLESSRRKAFTALTFRRPSSEFAQYAQSEKGGSPLTQLEHVVALGGGLPITSHGEIVGAVGVGGAPGGDKDALCANVGLDTIAARLN